MSIEQRIESLTVAMIELTETVRDLQQQMAHGQELQQQPTTPEPKKETPKKAPKAEKAPEPAPEPQPAAKRITREQLQSECIKKVRETGGDWFKMKLQDVLRERGVKTISQLPDDAVDAVHATLFEEGR